MEKERGEEEGKRDKRKKEKKRRKEEGKVKKKKKGEEMRKGEGSDSDSRNRNLIKWKKRRNSHYHNISSGRDIHVIFLRVHRGE